MFKCLDSILRTMKSILMDFKHKTILMFFQRSLWFIYIMGGVICPCFSCCSTIFKDQFYCESWTIKKAECRSIGAFWTVVLEKTLESPLDSKEIQPVLMLFELWCWRRLLSVPWTARRSNQSVLKEISPEYSLERLMLKLKLQYFGHVMWRTDSLEKTLTLGKIEGMRRRGRLRMRW